MRPSPLSCVLLLISGCGPALPDQLVEGRHVRYHYWADMGAPCPEAVEHIDRLAELLAAKVNRPLAEDFRLDYYRVRDLEAVRESCFPRAGGCAIGTKLYSPEWIQDHEVTHGVLYRLGLPPSVFSEGIAVVFECGSVRSVGAPIEKVDIAPLFDNAEWKRSIASKNYAAVGSFTKWLIDRHGLETFFAFYEVTEYDSTREELDGRFRDAFGLELSDAVAQWSALPASREGESCIHLDDVCAGEPDLVLPAGGSVTAPVSCVDRVSLLEVGAAPMTRLRFTASEVGRRLRVRPCEATGSPARDFFFTNVMTGPSRWIDWWTPLQPGRYSLSVERSPLPGSFRVNAPPGGTASIEVSSHGEIVNETCGAEPIVISDDTFVTAISVGGDGGVLRLEPQSDRRIAGLYGHVEEQVTLCTACSDTCRSFDVGTSYPDWLRGPTSVHLLGRSDGGVSSVEFLLEPPL